MIVYSSQTNLDKPSMAVSKTQLKKCKNKWEINKARLQASDKAIEMASKELGSKQKDRKM